MSQWMTSGASRLKQRQKRTFASRAQQRAACTSFGIGSMNNEEAPKGKKGPAHQRQRIVGVWVRSDKKQPRKNLLRAVRDEQTRQVDLPSCILPANRLVPLPREELFFARKMATLHSHSLSHSQCAFYNSQSVKQQLRDPSPLTKAQ
mmetsp:Transcript_23814/g.55543  ORF Transcript_23814/g.55543 Transcript_23814/m.55543 type:complete len:147 (-) Transcript_23814:1815-2255(-)